MVIGGKVFNKKFLTLGFECGILVSRKQTDTFKQGSFQMTKIKPLVRKKLNRALYLFTIARYYDGVSISAMNEILEKESYTLIQEDGTPWEGFLCGEMGSARIEIAFIDEFERLDPVTNSLLALQWFKMESGRYEINAYLS